jgi:hypothetical protein
VAGQRAAGAATAAGEAGGDGEAVKAAQEEYRKNPNVKNRAKIFALQRQQRNAA